MYDKFVAHYYYTLFTYLVIPFYAHLELSGRVSDENKESSGQGVQTKEEIDRLCKQEIDNLFDESDDDVMPDSPLFSRLREKERCELLTQSKIGSNSQIVNSMWAVNVNQGLDMWSIPNDHHESKNMFTQENQYSTHIVNGQDEIEIDCTENVHWAHDHRDFSMARSFEDPPAHICELLKFLDDDDFIDMWFIKIVWSRPEDDLQDIIFK